MHAEVLAALDVHLAEAQSLRRRLTDARAIEPGERLDVILLIAASAERLAHTLHAHGPAPAAAAALRQGRERTGPDLRSPVP